MSEAHQVDRDYVVEMIGKTIPICLVFPLSGAGLGYVIYGDSRVASGLSWEVGVFVAIICCFLLAFVYSKYRRTNALMAYGIVMSLGVVAIYYFFGVLGYFYFFLFSDENWIFRWIGAAFGLGLSVSWMCVAYNNVKNVIRATNFVEKAFVGIEGIIVYRIQNGILLFDEVNNQKRSPRKIYASAVYGVAPFGFVLYRILSTNFGGSGVLVFVAALGMPVSLWFVGFFVRVYLIMIALPVKVERQQQKRVVVAA